MTKGDIAIHKLKGEHKWTKPTTRVDGKYPYLESHCEICGKKASSNELEKIANNPFANMTFSGMKTRVVGSGMQFTTSSGYNPFATTWS